MNKAYYNEHAASFVEDTLQVDMKHLYGRFEKYLKEHDSVLDLGCGSGRDSLYFKRKGYKVTALDFSENLAEMASQVIGNEVIIQDMRKLSFTSAFDAIWASASILHICRDDIAKVMRNCHRALVDHGVFYSSFKYGDREEVRRGRHFNFYDEASFGELVESVGGFQIVEMLKTVDARSKRADEFWLNVIMKKI
ncbi:putative S-adenosyl-L-methionine-dependent methyltransferase TehB [Poriferisphaera corsica]|uniref:Putative S-adenosyl-L-methionine-dependent methyltransferase TehB n=1 Tax=Poriferisphaera corsica TaxID=2528020 RepID=A0A517YUT5_9BACT|nr:class I SAM-dependent methyltransferase [Poriferisphaera corsica]QDU33987.1 putative S-adenosyl-L-methionine-dependent methyltransferase TehB [Poriferisphaera corsica]